MTKRQETLLLTIVGEYIASAQPVSSGFLVAKIHDHVSSATVRNEMVVLENLGYIYQPHTSAGRVPTAKGYQFYVDAMVRKKAPNVKDQGVLHEISGTHDKGAARVKGIAKAIAALTDEAVIIAFGAHDVYYTGLSNLFAKPEFADQARVVSISQVIDQLDKIVASMFADVDAPMIRLGDDCPFGASCATVLAPLVVDGEQAVITVLGPLRMDYQKAFSLVDYIAKK